MCLIVRLANEYDIENIYMNDRYFRYHMTNEFVNCISNRIDCIDLSKIQRSI